MTPTPLPASIPGWRAATYDIGRLWNHRHGTHVSEYGRAEAVEWAYRVKNALTIGGPINAGLKKGLLIARSVASHPGDASPD